MSSKRKPSFAWINKDASNITSKTYKNKANSHAQSVTWDRRKGISDLERSSASLGQTRLPLRKKSSRNKTQQFVYRSEPDVEHQGFGRVATVPSLGSSLHLSDPASDSVYLLNTQLDPFMSLAGNTTRRERNLVHYYLTLVPSLVYGTSDTSAYCPVRDRTAIFVQNKNEWLQWVLVSAEVFLLGENAAKNNVGVLSRKASIYQTLRKAVSNSDTMYSDATIACITLAATTEARVGLLSEAQKHLAAAKRLIIGRGDSGRRIPITTIVAFIWIGTGTDTFPDSGSLEVAIASFTSSLLAFHQSRWIQEDHSAILKQAMTPIRVSPEGLLPAYIQSRRRAFHPLSPLRPFVEAVFKDQSVGETRNHMAILWVLNRILWNACYSYQDSISFLDRLYMLVASADLAKLTALTVLFMIVDCVARLGMFNEESHNTTDMILRHKDGDWRIKWLWEVVKVVEMLSLLLKETREGILHVLSAELVETETNREAFTESFLDHIADDIRSGWLHSTRP